MPYCWMVLNPHVLLHIATGMSDVDSNAVYNREYVYAVGMYNTTITLVSTISSMHRCTNSKPWG